LHPAWEYLPVFCLRIVNLTGGYLYKDAFDFMIGGGSLFRLAIASPRPFYAEEFQTPDIECSDAGANSCRRRNR
jgi:hypothetical protein